MRILPFLLAGLLMAGCASSSETTMSKEEEGKMKNWLEKGIPANQGGAAPAAGAPLQKNDPKTGTPTD